MKAKIDKPEAKRLYEGNWTVREIAEHMGVDRSRVYAALRSLGVQMRDDRLQENRTVSTRCGKGLHEFTPENTRVDKQGGRHCRACEQDYAVIRYWATKISRQ